MCSTLIAVIADLNLKRRCVKLKRLDRVFFSICVKKVVESDSLTSLKPISCKSRDLIQ
ncbi:hypothetical protein D3C80_2137130 [compost metagenome]